MKTEVFTWIDILGTAAFSISGVFAAMEKKLDLLGIFILAFITAIGGGTVRDVLIGDQPVAWMMNREYAIVIFISAAVAILFNRWIRNYEKLLNLFDALGLGFFTVVGLQKGIAFGFPPGLCVALGTITACFGGLIRDISLNHIPHIFHKEVYATACILGGILYFLLLDTIIPPDFIDSICIAAIFLIRMLAVRFRWTLPDVYKRRET